MKSKRIMLNFPDIIKNLKTLSTSQKPVSITTGLSYMYLLYYSVPVESKF